MPNYIVGVDPGVTTGICVVRIEDGKWKLVDRDTVLNVRAGESLSDLYDVLKFKLEWFQCNDVVVAMEVMQAYMSSAQEKSQAQGVVMLAAYRAGVVLHTYSPTTIRALVVGSGRAKAADVSQATRALTGIAHPKKGEAFNVHQQDALASALCCALEEEYLPILRPQEGIA
jgi:Holliday junction resolvasome RuvABC endonuclease subunit